MHLLMRVQGAKIGMNYGRIILKLAKDKEKAYSCDLSFRNLNDSGHYNTNTFHPQGIGKVI